MPRHWLNRTSFGPRPIVVVEDKVRHLNELLDTLLAEGAGQGPALAEDLTLVCLDRPGPDTERAVNRWRKNHPRLQVAMRATNAPRPDPLVHVLPAQVLQSEHLYLNELGKMLRPGSLMLLDIELEPLEFVPADEPWRSLDLVPWFRGSCRGLCIKLFTNKSFVATKLIGVLQQSNLSDDVLDKEQIAEEVVPELIEFVSRAFPWTLRSKQPNALSIGPLDTDDVAEHFDLVVGPEENGQVWIGGRIVEKRFKVNPKDSDEADAWKLLAEDQLKEHVGVSAKELFPTVVLEHRPQRVHRMRGKLKGDFGNADQGAIRTGDGAYRLDAQLRVGIVEPRGLRP